MNFKTTLILVVLVAVTAVLVLWLGPPLGVWLHLTRTAPDAQGQGTLAVLKQDLKPESLSRIEIKHDKDTLVFEKALNGEWELPGGWPTRKKPGVQELVELLTDLHSRFLPRPLGEDLKTSAVGMDSPDVTVTLKTTDGADYQLRFASRGEGDNANRANWPTYLQLAVKPNGESQFKEKDEVVRLSPDVTRVLKRPLAYYQQRQLFPAERGTTSTDKRAIRTALERLGLYTEPKQVVEALAQQKIKVEEPLVLEVLEEMLGGKSKEVHFAGEVIEVVDPANSYTIERDGSEWKLKAPHADHLLPDKLHNLLITLPDVWAEEFVEGPKDLKDYNLDEKADQDKPLEIVVTVASTGGKEQRKTLLIGKLLKQPDDPPPLAPGVTEPPPELHYAKLKGNAQVFVVNFSKLKQNVFLPYTDLRDPAVASFQTRDAVNVELVRDKDKIVFAKDTKEFRWTMNLFERDSGSKDWNKDPSLKSEVESGKLTTLLSNISSLRTDNKDDVIYDTGHKNAAKYGLDDSAARVTVILEEEEKSEATPAKDDGKEKPKKKRTITLRVGKKEKDKDQETGKVFVRVGAAERIDKVAAKDLLEQVERTAADFRKRRLFDWASNEVNTLSVARKDEKIELEHKDGRWNLTSPVQTAADVNRAQQLAIDVGDLEVIEFLKPEGDLKKYGLDVPAITVKGTTERDKKQDAFELTVGSAREGKPEFFARLNGRDDILVIGKAVVEALERNSLAYRPLEFHKLQPGEVGEVRIQKQKENEFTLAPHHGGWEVRAPFQADTLSALSQPVVDALTRLKAERYVTHKASAEDLEKFGLKGAYLRVSMVPEAKKGSSSSSSSGSGSGSTSSSGSQGSGSAAGSGQATEGSPIVLLIGAIEDKVKGSRFGKFADDDAVFALGNGTIAALDVQPLALLDPKLLAVPANSQIVAFESNVGGKPLKLALKDKKWTVAESAGGPFEPEQGLVQELIFTLGQLRAQEYKAYGSDIDWDQYGLKVPEFSVAIALDKASAKPHIIAFGKPVPEANGSYFARVDERPAVIVLDATTSGTIRQDYLGYVDRQVLKGFDPEKATKLQVKQGDRPLSLEKKDGGWQLDGAAPAKADDPTVMGLLRQLAFLRAKRVAAFPVKDFKDFSPDMPIPAVIVKLQTDKPIELQIGKVVEAATGDRLAMVTGSNVAFVLDGDVLRELLAPPIYFRDHVVARIKDEVDRVVLEVGDKKAIFAKIDGTWKLKTDVVDAEVDHDELEDFVNSLSKLRADALVAEKPADLKTYGLDAPRMRWRLQAGGKDALVLQMGKQGPDKEKHGHNLLRCYARVDQGEFVFLLDEKTTLQALGRFRVRRIWPNLSADQVQGLHYNSPKKSFNLEKRGDNWQSHDPAVAIDPKRVEETLLALAGLKAERFVAEKPTDLEPYGLKKPALKLEIQTTKGKLELQVGKQEPGTGRSYARALGAATTDVFLLKVPDVFRIVRRQESFAKPPASFPPGGFPSPPR